MTKALWENKEAIQQSSLYVSVRSDDRFYLALNQVPSSGNNLLASGGGNGGFMGPPAVLQITGSNLLQHLRPGRNCLNVTVEDIGGVITGFNLVGSLTTTGLDGIAKGPKGPSQFNACSSCKKGH
jgi:hypothetical protein